MIKKNIENALERFKNKLRLFRLFELSFYLNLKLTYLLLYI